MLKSFRNIKEILDPTRPTDGPRCGEWLYIVAKVQAGLPLSIVERDLAADALRQRWLTRKEYTAYQRWRELEHYEATKRLAHYGVPRGQREDWVQSLYGKSKEALKRYFIRRRTR
jgi:hypothetical protein